MKVLFVAQNLNIGGVQTSLCNICNTLINVYSDMDIEIFSFGKGVLAETLNSQISVKYGKYFLNLLLTPISEIKKERNRIDLMVRYGLILLAKLIGVKRLYSFLFIFEKIGKEYDIAISYFNDVPGGYSNKGTNWFVDGFVKAKKKAAWIHTDPEKARFRKKNCIIAYKNFDALVCVSNATKEKFDKFLPEFSSKTHVVYNAFETEKIKQKAMEYVPFAASEVFNIVTVGRNDNATKRFDKIIEICKMLKSEGISNFKWRIVGDGPDYKKNLQSTEQAGVTDVLEFVGGKSNPYPYIKNSDLFVLTSDYEGYPMVLGESLILEVPVVTTDFAASKEMIVEGVNGYITGMDAKSIFTVVCELIQNRQKYDSLMQRIKETCFDNQLCIHQIEKILKG